MKKKKVNATKYFLYTNTNYHANQLANPILGFHFLKVVMCYEVVKTLLFLSFAFYAKYRFMIQYKIYLILKYLKNKDRKCNNKN